MTESKLSSCDTSSLISFRASASSSFMTTLVSFCLNKARKVDDYEISTDHLTRAECEDVLGCDCRACGFHRRRPASASRPTLLSTRL